MVNGHQVVYKVVVSAWTMVDVETNAGETVVATAPFASSVFVTVTQTVSGSEARAILVNPNKIVHM